MPRYVLGLIGAVAILLTPTISGAASNPFVGSWKTTTTVAGIRLTISLVLNPQGAYSELDDGLSPISGRLMSRVTGRYILIGANTLRLNPVNWDPKLQCLPPSGCHPIRKPPGTTYRYKFVSRNTFTAQDVTFGNGPTLTYHRF
jgi:hypothetical protein